MQGGLAPELEGRELVVEGRVASLPGRSEQGVVFLFEPRRVWLDGRPVTPPRRIRLGWYGARTAELVPGERWRLRVRLKRPHGLANPGGFDYERWLFREGIGATGHVRESRDNRRLGRAPAGIDLLRHELRRRIDAALGDSPWTGVITALAIGDRHAISPAQWQVLRATGTNHLVAISGLHIGLLATAGFFLFRWLAALVGALSGSSLPAQRVAGAGAVLFALGYAALAGFAIPTLRALVMVAVCVAGIQAGRRLSATALLSVAAIAVLVLDPTAVLSPGFWLSFGAVVLIFYGTLCRRGMPGRLRSLVRLQLLVGIGLLPLLAAFFGQHPLIAPLANLIAVPWVSLTTVPLTLLGALGSFAAPEHADLLPRLAAATLDLLWPVLERLAVLPAGQWQPRMIAGGELIAAVTGTALLLAPAGIPLRHLGVIFLLPLALPAGPSLPEGGFRLTLLDVGQGLSAVVRTRSHLLVYDTGPRHGGGFDAGAAVLAPFLRARGERRIDLLLLSHGDSDHAGGARSLLAGFPVGEVVTAPDPRIAWAGGKRCRAGMEWRWDGVRLRVIHPGTGRWHGNDASCVLLIEGGGHRLLLSGDIERRAERDLVARLGAGLRAEVLVSPHHGSLSSSSVAFANRVLPAWVLHPAGYRNRFGFPKSKVVARWRVRGAKQLVTGQAGAIEMDFLPQFPVVPRCWREDNPRIWRARAGPGGCSAPL
ncbi:MAG: DNA internalization-related competence protein ComEC/Rec2 [Gammaproteobacteria bacterium]|nr:MAG: DNA internalization-related competence protein ComEC/Rec2 [Gammaproteobacteria bacterium]